MASDSTSVAELLERASQGNAAAADELLARHRGRLCRMVATRVDPRLSARIDPSDVVQEALLEASVKLTQYLQARPIDFYPWLRQIAWNRLVDLHRRHCVALRRSVRREESFGLGSLNSTSATALVEHMLASDTHPSQRFLHEELRRRVHAGLATLAETEREVLLLRYVEQLSTSETAAVLKVTEGVVKGRHRRAIEKLSKLLNDDDPREAS